jgi:hypothetical protein
MSQPIVRQDLWCAQDHARHSGKVSKAVDSNHRKLNASTFEPAATAMY